MSATTTKRDDALATTLAEMEATEATEATDTTAGPFELDELIDDHSASTSISPWKITWSTK